METLASWAPTGPLPAPRGEGCMCETGTWLESRAAQPGHKPATASGAAASRCRSSTQDPGWADRSQESWGEEWSRRARGRGTGGGGVPGSQPDSRPESCCPPLTSDHRAVLPTAPSSRPVAPGAQQPSGPASPGSPVLAAPSFYTFCGTVPPAPAGPHTLSS